MNYKQVTFMLAVIALIPIICACQNNMDGGGAIHKVNYEVPEGFLYAPEEGQTIDYQYQQGAGAIPEEYLLGYDELNNEIIYFEDGNYYCKSNSEQAQIVQYFSHNQGKMVSGGWYSRYAQVCDNTYYIFDLGQSWGTKIYGPFQLDSELV
ncbi:hypothetical protein JW868_01070 [Candidatus Woesearchaeota archaeon]|nr:hypothetical protein [Candidatus Woesearchaeota archaeon]